MYCKDLKQEAFQIEKELICQRVKYFQDKLWKGQSQDLRERIKILQQDQNDPQKQDYFQEQLHEEQVEKQKIRDHQSSISITKQKQFIPEELEIVIVQNSNLRGNCQILSQINSQGQQYYQKQLEKEQVEKSQILHHEVKKEIKKIRIGKTNKKIIQCKKKQSSIQYKANTIKQQKDIPDITNYTQALLLQNSQIKDSQKPKVQQSKVSNQWDAGKNTWRIIAVFCMHVFNPKSRMVQKKQQIKILGGQQGLRTFYQKMKKIYSKNKQFDFLNFVRFDQDCQAFREIIFSFQIFQKYLNNQSQVTDVKMKQIYLKNMRTLLKSIQSQQKSIQVQQRQIQVEQKMIHGSIQIENKQNRKCKTRIIGYRENGIQKSISIGNQKILQDNEKLLKNESQSLNQYSRFEIIKAYRKIIGFKEWQAKINKLKIFQNNNTPYNKNVSLKNLQDVQEIQTLLYWAQNPIFHKLIDKKLMELRIQHQKQNFKPNSLCQRKANFNLAQQQGLQNDKNQQNTQKGEAKEQMNKQVKMKDEKIALAQRQQENEIQSNHLQQIFNNQQSLNEDKGNLPNWQDNFYHQQLNDLVSQQIFSQISQKKENFECQQFLINNNKTKSIAKEVKVSRIKLSKLKPSKKLQKTQNNMKCTSALDYLLFPSTYQEIPKSKNIFQESDVQLLDDNDDQQCKQALSLEKEQLYIQFFGRNFEINLIQLINKIEEQ